VAVAKRRQHSKCPGRHGEGGGLYGGRLRARGLDGMGTAAWGGIISEGINCE
jgi:hypothetical protein